MDELLVQKFHRIWEEAKLNSPLNQKSAVCISTIDALGFPQSRFVDLKSVDVSGFTFCTSYDSEKGKNLSTNAKVSLIAWWDHVGYQIRVVGNALRISDELANKYWRTRSREAQAATMCFKQSEIWDSADSMERHYCVAMESANELIPRPSSWGGFTINPKSIEFLKFNSNRVHNRELFVKEESTWEMQLLQP